MIDFTLQAYCCYLSVLRNKYKNIITFNQYFKLRDEIDTFCILRHDVDRFPQRALQMAVLENKLGVRSTYYFRINSHNFKKNIIKQISDLGHEIGYHYECLSASNGDFEKSIENFSINLEKFRRITEISTVAMHSAPLSRYDSRNMWEYGNFHSRLKNEFCIMGEVYIDIDYSDIVYITDAGRNWINSKNNLRDYVNSKIKVDIDSNQTLIKYFKDQPPPKIIFSTHPERWPVSELGFYQSLCFDKLANIFKVVLHSIRPRNLYSRSYY